MSAPGPNEVLIRNRAVALNPFDRIVQTLGGLVTPWLDYPCILGSDVAGEVVAVGTGVSRFKPGDRVAGLALGVDKVSNRPAEGAFQHYVLLREDATTAIPEAMSFERAAVLPLAIATAASGLFLADQLGLERPRHPASGRRDGTVIVWGGSTSVGSCAIQLARAAGYDVATTASPRNFEHVRRLGASLAFDYRDPAVMAHMTDALRGRQVVGALAIGAGSGKACIELVRRAGGRRIVSMASAPLPLDGAPLGSQRAWKLATLPRLALGFAGLALRARLAGVTVRSLWGTALVKDELGRHIFRDFLGPALAQGVVVPAPEPLVSGHDLRDIPAAMELLRRGVSARKIVVALG
ncbi:MAG TPA: zinc-binding alcohol dehydrogenase family protein [Burkholderiaceae bacterium]